MELELESGGLGVSSQESVRSSQGSGVGSWSSELELESGDSNWESRHLGGSRWGKPIKSLLSWGLSPGFPWGLSLRGF